MEAKRIIWYLKNIVLQLLERMHAHDFLTGMRVSKDEIAKAHMLFEDMTEVYSHHLRVLVDKAEALSFGLFPIA